MAPLSDNKIQFTIVVDGTTGEAAIRQFGDGVEQSGKRAAESMGKASAASDKLGGSLAQTGNQGKEAMDRTSSATERASSATQMAEGLVRRLAEAYATIKLAEHIKDSVLLAARYETLGVVMTTVGRQAGYSGTSMEGFAKGLQETGISMEASRQGVVRMIQANVELTKSNELGRIAQNAAVVGNINSSEAFERMMTGIATGQSILMHHLGLMTNFEKAYLDAAHAAGKTTNDLSETEKGMIRVNEVIRAGTSINGAYEASMSTAGKQLLSMVRYVQDLMVIMGTPFLPEFSGGVKFATDKLKELNSEFSHGTGKRVLEEMAKDAGILMSAMSDLASHSSGDIATIIGLLTAAKAAQIALNIEVAKNPYAQMALVVMATNEALKEMNRISEKTPGMFKIIDNSIGKLPEKFNEMQSSWKGFVDSVVGNTEAGGRIVPETEKISKRIVELQEDLKKTIERPWYMFQLFPDADFQVASIKKIRDEIAALQKQVMDKSTATLSKAQGETDRLNEEYQQAERRKAEIEITKKATEAQAKFKKQADDVTKSYLPLIEEQKSYKLSLETIATMTEKGTLTDTLAATARKNLYESTSWGKDELKAQEKAQKEANKASEEGRREYQAVLDKLEPLRVEQEEYNKALAVLNLMDPSHATDRYTKAVETLNAGLTKNIQAERDRIGELEHLEKATEALAEYTMTDDERRINDLKKINEEMNEYVDWLVTSKNITREQADIQVRKNNEQLQKNIATHKKTSDEVTKLWDHAYKNMTDNLADWLATGKFGMDDFSGYFKKMVATMVATWIMGQAKMIMLPGSSSTASLALGKDLSSMGGMAGILAAPSSGASSSLGIGLGGISIANELINPGSYAASMGSIQGAASSGLTSAGFSEAGSDLAFAESSTFGSWTAGIGTFVMGLLSGKSLGQSAAEGAGAGVGAWAGGKGGAAVGSYFGPVGTVVGGAIGAILGGLAGALGMGSLFGGKEENQFSLGDLSPATANKWNRNSGFAANATVAPMSETGYWFPDIGNAYIASMNEVQKNFNTQVASLKNQMSATAWDAFSASLESQTFDDTNSGRWGVSHASDAVTGAVTTYATSLTTGLNTALHAALLVIIDEALGKDSSYAVLTDAMQSAINTAVHGSTFTADQLSQISTYLTQIKAATAPIQEILDTDGLSDYEKNLRGINNQFDAYAEQLKAAGIDLAKYTDLDKARNLQLMAAADDYFDKIEGRFTSALEKLNPTDTAQTASAQLGIVLAQARQGDFSGLSSLDGLATTLAGQDMATFASKADYQRSLWSSYNAVAEIERLAKANAPKFAGGGDHDGGWRMVGENGPELEYTGPSQIFNNSQSTALVDNSELVAEVRALRAELKQALFAVAKNTGKTSEQLQRWEFGGMPDVRAA